MAVAILTDQHKPNHFAFFTPSKSYHLRAESISEANSWVSHLKQTVDDALDCALPSSFKRLGVLESTIDNTPSRLKPFNRHSFHPQNTKVGQSHRPDFASLVYNSSPTTPLNHPTASLSTPQLVNLSSKRHSINTLDVSKIAPKNVPGYTNNNNNNNLLLDTYSIPSLASRQDSSVASSSKFSKTFGSATSPGSSRSDYFSPSILTSTDDMQSSLSSQPDVLDDSLNSDYRKGLPLAKEGHNTPKIQQVIEEPAEIPDLVPPTGFDPDIEDIVESGYLIKRRKKYSQWRKVWLVLTTQRVLIYKTEPANQQLSGSLESQTNKTTSQKHSKHLHLSNASSTSLVSTPFKYINARKIVDVMEMDPISKSKKYCMQIITPEKRLQFATTSEEDLIRWIAAFKFVLDGVQGI